MTTLVACVSILLGVWVVQALAFVLTYKTSLRAERSGPVEPLL